jgi:predicted nucleic acid-binding protein
VTPVFVDTGYLIALEAADDQHHDAALRHWADFITPVPPLVSTSYVFDEVVTFFNSRNQHGKASEIGNRLLCSPTVQFVHVDETLFFDGWRYFTQHADKSYPGLCTASANISTECRFEVRSKMRLNTELTYIFFRPGYYDHE